MFTSIKINRNGAKVSVISEEDFLRWKSGNFTEFNSPVFDVDNTMDNSPKQEIKYLAEEWLEWCSTGKLTGKPLSKRMVEIYDYYFSSYLKLLGRNPNQPIICIENVRAVFGNIDITSYSTRKNIYDSIMSFSKFLIEKNILDEKVRNKIKDILKQNTKIMTVNVDK